MRTAIVLGILLICGCGKSASEIRLSAELAAATEELATVKAALAESTAETNETSRRLHQLLAKEPVKTPFVATAGELRSHLQQPANGGFAFTNSPANPGLWIGRQKLNHGAIEIHEAPDGTIESVTAMMNYSAGISLQEIVKRMKIVNDLLSCVAPEIPNLEAHNLVTLEMQHIKDKVNVHREWSRIEGRCWAAKELGIVALTLQPKRD